MDSQSLNDSVTRIGENVDGLHLNFRQEIPDDFLADLQSERLASATVRAGEFHKVATVPTVCYELWIRQGHDPYRWSAKELLSRLRSDGLDAFIATNKSI